MSSDHVVREQLLALLNGGNGHMPFEKAVADFPNTCVSPSGISWISSAILAISHHNGQKNIGLILLLPLTRSSGTKL